MKTKNFKPDADADAENAAFTEPVSKSQLKRESEALQKLGQQLAALSTKQLGEMPLDGRLRDAIIEMQGLKANGAKRRQRQYIGRLMREAENPEAIRQAFEVLRQQDARSAARQHSLEQWRTRLLDEEDDALTELLNTHPDADRQHLRQLIRSARKERDLNKPPKSARELFRYLRELIDAC